MSFNKLSNEMIEKLAVIVKDCGVGGKNADETLEALEEYVDRETALEFLGAFMRCMEVKEETLDINSNGKRFYLMTLL